MHTLCKYRGCCQPGPTTSWIKQYNGQGGALPACVSPLSLARRRSFEPARHYTSWGILAPPESWVTYFTPPSSARHGSAQASDWAQTLGERSNKNICRITLSAQKDRKDFPSSSVAFIIQRFCRTRVFFWWCGPWLKARRKPRVAEKMSGRKWGWSEHNLQLQLSERAFFYHDILQ